MIKIFTGLEKKMQDLSETFNKEIENIKKKKELKNTITEIKNTLERLNSRLEDAEEQISNLQDRVMKSTKVKQQKEKRNFKNKNKLSYLLHNIKQTNIYIIEVPQEERKI